MIVVRLTPHDACSIYLVLTFCQIKAIGFEITSIALDTFIHLCYMACIAGDKFTLCFMKPWLHVTHVHAEPVRQGRMQYSY